MEKEKVETPEKEEQETQQPESDKKQEAQKVKGKNLDYIRLYADFENYRRRTSEERLKWTTQTKSLLLKRLLPIIDNLERAIENAGKEEATHTHESLTLLLENTRAIFTAEGVKPMDIAPGSPFDVKECEALSTLPPQKEEEKGTIAQIVEKGYLLNHQTLRIAKVIIYSHE